MSVNIVLWLIVVELPEAIGVDPVGVAWGPRTRADPE